MKHKIDYIGTGYLLLTITAIVSLFIDLDNIITCWETSTYQVMICTYSLSYWTFNISISLWLCYTLYNVIKIACFKVGDEDG